MAGVGSSDRGPDVAGMHGGVKENRRCGPVAFVRCRAWTTVLPCVPAPGAGHSSGAGPGPLSCLRPGPGGRTLVRCRTRTTVLPASRPRGQDTRPVPGPDHCPALRPGPGGGTFVRCRARTTVLPASRHGGRDQPPPPVPPGHSFPDIPGEGRTAPPEGRRSTRRRRSQPFPRRENSPAISAAVRSARDLFSVS